ncbi:phage adaptor protein [Thiohalorhabdus sp.]|uniref:phage adaptor protein n=1 Tax=Thiohalorhabdus sp. TaxID=3094134 RepID=UPI002FC2B76F
MATLNDLLAQARIDLDDPEQPGGGDDSLSLFKTNELVSYINRAIDEACLRAELILDSDTPDVCEVAVTAGQAKYDLDSRIVLVKRAKLASQPRALKKTDRDALDGMRMDWESDTGTPEMYLADMNQGIRLYPIPDTDTTLRLTVWRRPLEPIPSYMGHKEPPIPPEDHYPLLHWVYYLALDRQDVDTYAPEKAMQHAQAFAQQFGRRKAAWEREFDRKSRPLRVPGSYM